MRGGQVQYTVTDVGPGMATAVNAGGQVVGGNGYAFLYSNGTMTGLGAMGGTYSLACGINSSDQVVGVAQFSDGLDQAFLYSDGTMTDLSTPAGCSGSYALGVNTSGQVVGYAFAGTDGYPERAFLYSNGAMTDLGTLGGASNGAEGINDMGQVAGWTTTSSGSSSVAFLYSNGAMFDLNSLVPSAWTLTEATAINDSGQIVGQGINAAGQTDAFLLTPTPEPSTIALLLASAACLLAFAWRRRQRNS
jgi:probable HAF family extracellular repeat protein